MKTELEEILNDANSRNLQISDRFKELAQGHLINVSRKKKKYQELELKIAIQCIRDYYCLPGSEGMLDGSLWSNSIKTEAKREKYFYCNYPKLRNIWINGLLTKANI